MPFLVDSSISTGIEVLQEEGKDLGIDYKMISKEFAEAMDKADPLASYREKFNIPVSEHTGKESYYFCGNSLGLMPKQTEKYVNRELTKWAKLGVEGHFQGEIPWVSVDEKSTELLVDIVGAKDSSEIAVMGSLSNNIHLLMACFFQPTKQRYKIMIEDGAFCSDQHIVRSQLRRHGLHPENSLVKLAPRKNETFIRTEDILKAIKEEGESIAVILIGGVQFYSGQVFDMEKITAAGHAAGCFVGFDLAHCAGNYPCKLHNWNVDFAAWCSYKYLNAGAGGISGIFVHKNLEKSEHVQKYRLEGWWGQTVKQRFKMLKHHEPLLGAKSFQLSNPAVFPTVCLQSSLEIFVEAGMEKLRQKSFRLTAYLEYLLTSFPNCKKQVKILTPPDIHQRGCQLSLFFTDVDVGVVHQCLEKDGVICDVRKPSVMRIAPTPLYNKFTDVYNFCSILEKALQNL